MKKERTWSSMNLRQNGMIVALIVIILGFGGAAMFFLHMIVRLITAIRECNRDLKEQEDALSVQVWAQVIVFYVLMIRCRNNIKKA